MLKPESLHLTTKPSFTSWFAPVMARALLGAAVLLVLLPSASAQSFSLQFLSSGFVPDSVQPGGTTSATVTVTPLNGFSGSVDLSCQITPPPNTGGNQGCLVSPQTITAPSGSSVTVSTLNSGFTPPEWPAGGYTITITGTAGSETETATARVTVLSITPSFTITVTAVITPTSVPAGSGASGTINVNPINGYIGNVTLSCSSVSPVVVSPPACTFSYPSGMQSLPISGVPATSTITINTIGPLSITRASWKRGLYALWLPIPLLAFAGLGAGAGGKRWRVWGLIALVVLAGLVLLMPACATTPTPQSTTPNNLITPNGTYTFTVTGVDANGNAASNTSSGSVSSVALTVTSATTN
jgi:hypothetical protein